MWVITVQCCSSSDMISYPKNSIQTTRQFLHSFKRAWMFLANSKDMIYKIVGNIWILPQELGSSFYKIQMFSFWSSLCHFLNKQILQTLTLSYSPSYSKHCQSPIVRPVLYMNKMGLCVCLWWGPHILALTIFTISWYWGGRGETETQSLSHTEYDYRSCSNMLKDRLFMHRGYVVVFVFCECFINATQISLRAKSTLIHCGLCYY